MASSQIRQRPAVNVWRLANLRGYMSKRFGSFPWMTMLIGALALVGCDDANSPIVEPVTPVASVEVVGPLIELEIGAAVQLSATPRAADGSALTGRQVNWSSSDTTVAKVTSTGWLTTLAAGAVTIRAAAEGKTGTLELGIVTPSPTVAHITLSPGAAVMAVGATRQYQATAFDANGQVMTGLPVAWRSSDTTRAMVSASGLVTAIAPGYTDIVAVVGGRVAAVGLTVLAPEPPVPVHTVIVNPRERPVWVGSELQLTAYTFAQSGGELRGRVVTWSSESPAIVQVDASGKLTAVAPGTARIRAVSEGRAGYATITVRAYPTGPVHEYQFAGTFEWRVPFLDLGPTTWTDPNGVVRVAYRVMTGGSLRLIFADNTMPRWEQDIVLDTYLSGQLPDQPVARDTLRSSGALWQNWTDGSYILRNGTSELRTQPLFAGELVVYQRLFNGPELPIVWELR